MAKPTKYPYAVMDENQDIHAWAAPDSCHFTREAAIRRAQRLNDANPNAHYRAVAWYGKRWDRQQPVACRDTDEAVANA
jgi:hypothetical protein